MDGKIQVSQELFDRMTGCESQEELKALLDGLTVLNFGDGFMKEPLFIGVDWADGESKPSPLRPECPVRFHWRNNKMSTGNLRNNRLFPNSSRTARAQESAERASRILQQMQRELQYPTGQSTQQIQSQARQLASALQGTGGLLPVERQLVRMAESVERMAKAHQNSVVSQILGSLGNVGSLVQSWLRGREGQQSFIPLRDQVQQAMNMLSQFAPSLATDPITPEQAGGTRIGDWFEGASVPDLPAIPRRPGQGSSSSAGGRSGSGSSAGSGSGGGRPPDSNSHVVHPSVTVLPDGRWNIRGPGYHRTLDPNDPVLTGQMIRVQSSNVYAIGYEFNFQQPLKGKLIVRYKQKDRRGGPGNVGGPTYEYKAVHPDWFPELANAGSKGRWVWDQLRIRGTVAGHQYEYNLTRAAQGYLPRRAMVRDGVQRFVRRQRTAIHDDGRREILRSPLPNQVIGRYSPTAHRPNIGNMDRGRLERGTPNRGR